METPGKFEKIKYDLIWMKLDARFWPDGLDLNGIPYLKTFKNGNQNCFIIFHSLNEYRNNEKS